MKNEDNTLLIAGAVFLGGTVLMSNRKRASVVRTALSYLGTNYEMGGTDKSGIDCSGLTQKAYESVGVKLPRVAAKQRLEGTEIPVSQAAAGDLAYWISGRANDHVGIFDGQGGIINASSVAGQVTTDKITYWRQHGWLSGARRIL